MPSGTAEGIVSNTFEFTDWRVDILAGTTVAFIATDANGMSGGMSTVYNVNPGARDTSCFNALSPKQTAVPPAPGGGGSGGLPVGAVAGIAVGATVILIAFIILIVVLLRRRRERERELERYLEPIEPDHANHSTPTRTSVTPFSLQRPSILPTMSERTDGSTSGPQNGPYNNSNASSSNVIVHVHTDLEDSATPVVHELPPQYADRRDSFASGSGSSSPTTPPLDTIHARVSNLGDEFNPYGNTLTVPPRFSRDKKR